MRIVIVSAGQVGYHIASRFALENKNVVIIDKNPEAIQRVSDDIDVQTLVASGSSPAALVEAGIKEAEILLAVTNSDEVNLVACLVAKLLSPSTKKLARIRSADFDKYHDRFRENAPYIDTIINPEIEAVKTIDLLMSVPGAVDVGEFAGGRIKFVGVYLDAACQVARLRLQDFPDKLGAKAPLIAAVVRNEELIIPTGKDQLLPGDLVYLISEDHKLADTLSNFGKHAEPAHRVLIIGVGRLGIQLASLLEKKSLYCKIIEKQPERCTHLAECLNKPVILHGDGSDQGLLCEENIHEVDVAVTLTNDDETNILTSLLAKRLGVRKSITRISKFSYFPLMTAIGIEQVVSPRLSAINTILQHICRGKVLTAFMLSSNLSC